MIEFFDHTADIGMRVEASTLEDLLSEALRGLRLLLVGESEVMPRSERRIAIANAEPELMLFDALNETLYLFECDGFLPSHCDARRTSGGVEILMRGDVFDPLRHGRSHEVKAVTYHGLEAKWDSGRWRGSVVFDI